MINFDEFYKRKKRFWTSYDFCDIKNEQVKRSSSSFASINNPFLTNVPLMWKPGS